MELVDSSCYDTEVGGKPCACILWYREKRGERLEIYTEGISPCSRTVYQTCNIMYICNRGVACVPAS